MRISLIKQLFFVLILSGVAIGCHPSNKITENSSAVERTDTCLSNPAHTYQVFIPAHEKSEHDLPLLVAIDPHGSGKTAVEHLKEAASTYPAVLVASNLIQNDDPEYLRQLDELISDAKKRLPVGNRIYLAGFSGGARMALSYALNHPVNGVIASGAFAGADQLAEIKSPVVGLIGMDDFNFLETVQFILNPGRLPSNAHVELTQASHQWPEKARLANVFGWFRLSDESDKKFSNEVVAQYVKTQRSRIDSLIETNELLPAACICRNMASVGQFEKIGAFSPELNELTNREAYKKQIDQLVESLRFELKMRQTYGQALLEQNQAWWKKEISALHEKMNSEPNEITRMAYKRLSGFIGIFCYTYSKQFAAKRDVPHLEQILMVYRLAEPENPDMKHFSEVLEQLKKLK